MSFNQKIRLKNIAHLLVSDVFFRMLAEEDGGLNSAFIRCRNTRPTVFRARKMRCRVSLASSFARLMTDISQKLRTFATALSRGSSAGYRSADVMTSPFFHRKYEYRVHFLREIPPLIFQFQYVFRNSRGHSPRSKSR